MMVTMMTDKEFNLFQNVWSTSYEELLFTYLSGVLLIKEYVGGMIIFKK